MAATLGTARRTNGPCVASVLIRESQKRAPPHSDPYCCSQFSDSTELIYANWYGELGSLRFLTPVCCCLKVAPPSFDVDTIAAEPDAARRSIRPLLEEEETPAAFPAVHAVGDSPRLSFHNRPLPWRVSASSYVQEYIRYILAKRAEVVQLKEGSQLWRGGSDASFCGIFLHSDYRSRV